MAENGLVLQDNKPCGTKPAVIIKLSSELCRVVPAHAGTECSGGPPFPPLKSLIRKLGSSQSPATSFQRDSSASSGPGDHGKKALNGVRSERNSGRPIMSAPSPANSIHLPHPNADGAHSAYWRERARVCERDTQPLWGSSQLATA